MKYIRSDNGTEIIQGYCTQLFAQEGIIHQRSLPNTPQQNGRVERKHRHLLDTSRAIRFHANLPIKFWGDCLLAATYLINLMPTAILNWKTPFEVLMKKTPTYDQLRVIGCLCYVAHKTSDKFAPRATKCIFLGYPFAQKGYKCYNLQTQKIILSRNVTFKEDTFPFASPSSSDPSSFSSSLPTPTFLVNPPINDSSLPTTTPALSSPVHIPHFSPLHPTSNTSSSSPISADQLTTTPTDSSTLSSSIPSIPSII